MAHSARGAKRKRYDDCSMLLCLAMRVNRHAQYHYALAIGFLRRSPNEAFGVIISQRNI